MRRPAFSTLGCPGAPVREVVALARRHSCGGVELRCADGEILTPDATEGAAARVGRQFADEGVEVMCLASYIQVGAADAGTAEALRRHLRLARAVGAPCLRVFGGDPGDPDTTARAAERLARAAEDAAEAQVRILLETHDAFLTGRAVADVLRRAGKSPHLGALWDVVNPWRAGESLADTAAALAGRLVHVQLKDVASPHDLAPVLPSSGAVPLAALCRLLDETGYSGWLSLEWEAAWYPRAAPLDQALAAFRALLRDVDRLPAAPTQSLHRPIESRNP
ncbi:sugar phosphate isomerase/epimerase [Streptomyces sp. TRM66268-LWL]|uniref:Sugar phosphate isomerase/epimerase n=1 Tax=Streptomyces polyasparticus TaxID=2767826 RepID=A0ABR7SI18_9ACTN|nr:sugar phosphate isomerase/epimerase family protein [Streptomyces polyasparticus]MBC9715145.1 sugar phosphate isomerase/epimerase [Streptomyces polyasparticus]